MSKGTLNGLLKGKLGNSVFYKVTNSADKEKQGVRQYVATIANPRTAPQATQRMRMKPAINFYRGLADLLDHSWEGVKYGALSRQKFMQLALSPTLEGIPYVDKGESRFIPGNYPVSIGSVSVNTSNVTFGDQSLSDSWGFLWAGAPHRMDDYSITWAAFSQGLIDLNSALRDGDEITFIGVFDANGLYIPMHSYVVLDVSSTLSAYEIFKNARVVIGVNGLIQFARNFQDEDLSYDNAMPGMCVAAAVIVSRHPTRTSSTWLRTSSNMVVSDAFKAQWMSADRFAAAQATYRNSTTDLTSDWLLNQAENQQNTTGGSGGGGGLIQQFTLETKPVTPVGASAAIERAYFNNGDHEGFIAESMSTSNSAYNVVTNLYTLDGRTLSKVGGSVNLPKTAYVVPLNEYSGLRTEIAKFYTFSNGPVIENPD